MFGPAARLALNAIPVVHLAIVFEVGLWVFAGTPAFELTGMTRIVLGGLTVAGWFLLIVALDKYNLGRFSGLAQLRAARAGEPSDDDEPLIVTGLHARVRHPLYSAAFLILCGAAWNDLGLATAVWGSLYLWVGSHFEECRLSRLHGDAYQSYRRRVPAFVPWRPRA